MSFTDASGNRFEYKVAAVEALPSQSVEERPAQSGRLVCLRVHWMERIE